MLKTRLITLIVPAMFLIFSAGCYPPVSLNPFYTEKDVVFDASLLGEWIDEDELYGADGHTWKFTNNGKKNCYLLEILKGDRSDSFIAHLFKIEDTLYFDMYPDMSSLSGGDNDLNVLMIPTHAILHVKKTESTLEMYHQWFEQYVKDFPGVISGTLIHDRDKFHGRDEEVQVLTSSTEELQDLLIKIQNIEGTFLDSNLVLYRKSEK